jgi:hypothetical protein
MPGWSCKAMEDTVVLVVAWLKTSDGFVACRLGPRFSLVLSGDGP